MKRFVLAVLFALVPAVVVSAQTTQTLQYDYPDIPANVATYTQTVKVDGAPVTATPSCVAAIVNAVPGTTCSVTITQLSSASHTIDITATKGGMSMETIFSGVNPANGAKGAVNIRVVTVTTVTVQ